MDDDDKAAIFRDMQRMRAAEKRLEKSRSYFSPEFEREVWNVFNALIEKSKRQRRGSRFRALRFLRSRLNQSEIRSLEWMLREQSDAELRFIVKKRAPEEKPDGVRVEREVERHQRTMAVKLATEQFTLQGYSQEDAISKAVQQLELSLSVGTVKQLFKELSTRSKERGYVDPTAPAAAILYGARNTDDIADQTLTIAQLTKKGRPKKRN